MEVDDGWMGYSPTMKQESKFTPEEHIIKEN